MPMSRLAVLILLGFCAAVVPGLALAGPPPPRASIDQYVEQLPTATGNKAIGSGGADTKVPSLAPKSGQATPSPRASIDQYVEQLPTATGNKALGSGGADTKGPSSSAKSSGHAASLSGNGNVKSASVGGGAAAAASAVTSASDSRIIGVAVVLLLLSIVALGAAVARHRRAGDR